MWCIFCFYESKSDAGGLRPPLGLLSSARNVDRAVVRFSEIIRGSQCRFEWLQSAEGVLREAGPLTRPLAFIRYFDRNVAIDTWKAWKPAVPLTIEGVVYAIAGGLVGAGVYQIFVRPFIKKGRKRLE